MWPEPWQGEQGLYRTLLNIAMEVYTPNGILNKDRMMENNLSFKHTLEMYISNEKFSDIFKQDSIDTQINTLTSENAMENDLRNLLTQHMIDFPYRRDIRGSEANFISMAVKMITCNIKPNPTDQPIFTAFLNMESRIQTDEEMLELACKDEIYQLEQEVYDGEECEECVDLNDYENVAHLSTEQTEIHAATQSDEEDEDKIEIQMGDPVFGNYDGSDY